MKKLKERREQALVRRERNLQEANSSLKTTFEERKKHKENSEEYMALTARTERLKTKIAQITEEIANIKANLGTKIDYTEDET